ncbi:metallophosphoesterase [Candidatus Daviesbacteria bacterium]|nr:metallophosphoesterase [Candidatus Daviesbacteria bacterium]
MAAMGDLHMQQSNIGSLKQPFAELSTKADILLLCGDLTDNGDRKEAIMLAEELSSCKIPIIGVLGNHDYTNGQQNEIMKILSKARMFFLGEEPFVFEDVGFAGVKGFCGGFDNHTVTPFGEQILKQFVYESVSESMKLEEALRKLQTKRKIVALHFSPIRQTLKGESLEIYPFLGTSRLLDPIENYNATCVFHGHAHYGTPRGHTAKGIPVYNVALPLLIKTNPKKPYIIVEI